MTYLCTISICLILLGCCVCYFDKDSRTEKTVPKSPLPYVFFQKGSQGDKWILQQPIRYDGGWMVTIWEIENPRQVAYTYHPDPENFK